MKNRILLKLFAIGFLGLLLCIPLMMISGTISERSYYRQTVIDEIARSDSGPQTINGPVLIVPYRTARWSIDNTPNRPRELVWTEHSVKILPQKLSINGQLKTDQRQRGIYRATVYGTDLQLDGTFQIPPLLGVNTKEVEGFEMGQPVLAVGIADIRGIKQSPKSRWNSQAITFEPGTQLPQLGSGIHARVPDVTEAGGTVPFQLSLKLSGMDNLNFMPLGRDTDVSLTSSWRHPSFFGQYLPESRTIDKNGFQASWKTSWFATNANERFQQCLGGNCENFNTMQLGVKLMDPVDSYVMSGRSVKYGFLFVFLTFGAFFLFEALKRMAVHPVQYGMVGLALALFFLLVVSLSEHIPFAAAYATAAIACVTLNGFYVAHALKHRLRGLGFAGLLGALYGLLYLLLQSEDYALLLGSLLLFLLLAVAMVLTRKVDWYQLGQANEN
ncbi:cell envelope integrity protein CreD [Chitinivorax sp. B]|uniref:cell envelope integrity protein CreD n=1 Tax=Chitinivorax sp. B TaxID=2502235 RepID=UPI0010F58CA3|nr:cell envelope integrity protein CreD [Chitinivorax sp. B]